MGAVAESPLLETPALDGLEVEHLCDFSVDLEPTVPIATPNGIRMPFVAKRGRVDGPRLKGEVLPGSTDWLLVGPDLVGRVDVRAMVRTDDDALIQMTAGGVIKVPPDGMQRLADGERLPFGETYVRTTPKFETSDERYEWLNELVLVAHNELSQDHVDYRMYRVL
jgi:hypothetical protein